MARKKLLARRARRALATTIAAAAAALAVPVAALAVAPEHPAVKGSVPPRLHGDTGLPFLDVRTAHAQGQAPPAVGSAQAQLHAALGPSGVLQVDPVDGTPRAVLELDGFLTPPSGAPAQAIARGYVRDHLAAFGLAQSDLANLRLVKDYTDIEGTHHLAWVQTSHGIPAFDSQVAANVTRDGQLINVLGPMVPHFGIRSATPRLGPGQALTAALDNAHGSVFPAAVASHASDVTQKTVFVGGNSAQLVVFGAAGRSRLAWQVRAKASPTADYVYVVDADTGAVLWRANMVSFATGDVWEYYPSDLGCNGGCTQRVVTFPASWQTGSTLSGNFAHAYVDANDDDTPTAGLWPSGDDVAPGNYPYTSFDSTGWNCSTTFNCTWSQFTPSSWQTNVKQNVAQVYYYVSKFHDHLLAAPIGFTEAAGNFQQTNSSGQGLGGDAVQAQADDGANLQDQNHIDNANMLTMGDGIPPRMQMYLFRGGDFTANSPDANGGDDASVIYHEYTHGLSHRLVSVGANDTPALNTIQSGAMGEGWSDWYALDFLIDEGYDADTSAVGDVNVAFFTSGGSTIRTEPMDCPVGNSNTSVCPGGSTPHYGGYTYGDYGQVVGSPEVHADGEIWAQTLWQVREALGSTVSESDITRGMELSAPNPSFLDMRNAIIQADNVTYGGAHRSTLWAIFAQRGMGYFADTTDGNDTSPTQDFTTESSALALPKGTLAGTVTDADTHAGISGVSIGIANHNSGSQTLDATTNASGQYSIQNIPQHTYTQVLVGKTGYEAPAPAPVTITGGATTTQNFVVRRDWASIWAGASVVSASPPDYSSFGCGASAAFDQSLSTGWGSDTGAPRAVVLRLPQAINLASFAMDPGATCGDPDNASVAQYRIETSPDGSTWTIANQGTFGSGNDHHLNSLTPTAGTSNVRYLRLTMLTNQGNAQFEDMSELVVYGLPAAASTPPDTTITSGPASGAWVKAAPVYGFSSSPAGASFQCRVDAQPYAACTSPDTVSIAGLAQGAHTFFVRAVSGGVADATPATRIFKLDNVAPTAPSAVGRTLTPNALLPVSATGAIPTTVAWTAASDATSGVSFYQVWQNVDNGGWTFVANVVPLSLVRQLTPGALYQFRVRAYDRAGNFGAFTLGGPFRVTATQETDLSYSASPAWTTLTNASTWYGGTDKVATGLNAQATVSIPAGTKQFGWVSVKGPGAGIATISVDGTVVKTVDRYKAAWKVRRDVAVVNVSPATAHVVTITTTGKNASSTGYRSDVDAIVELR